MNNLRVSIAFILITCSNFIFSSCGDKEDNVTIPEPTISVTDENALSQAIKVENAKVKQGNPPASSTDGDAPYLSEEWSEDEGELMVVNGKKTALTIPLLYGTAKGVYLQIQGANSYFDASVNIEGFGNGRVTEGEFGKGDLPFTKKRLKSSSNDRTSSSDDYFLEIEIPSSIKPGIFCVSYCVYDAQNRVSNVIERCIEVIQLGGGEAGKILTQNAWTLEQYTLTETYNGETETYVVKIGQKTATDKYTYYCAENQEKTVYDSVLYRKFDMSLAANGGMELVGNLDYWYLDNEKSTCAKQVFEKESEAFNEKGAWSYANGKLTWIYEFETEEGEPIESYAEQYDAMMNGDRLVMTMNEGDFGYNVTMEIIFRKK
jgi:hypothetical protein